MNGDRYDGNWKDDLPAGYGAFVYRNGEVARGNWSSGQLNGDVEIDLQGGDRFRG